MAAYDRDKVEAGDRAADAALVSRAKAGDAPAFENLYRRHVARLYALCVRLTADPGLAEEVTQDAFVLAWRKLGEYRGESALASWLHRIAVNEVLRVHRTRRRRHAWMESFRRFPGADQPASGGQAGLRVDLETAIARLPDGARTVFVLHDVEGYRHEEIALMLGIAPGTCKAQLHHARRKLRKELDQ